MSILTTIRVLSRSRSLTDEARLLLCLRPHGRSVFLVRLACWTANHRSLGVLERICVLVWSLHVALVWRGWRLLFRGLVLRAHGGEKLHRIGEDVGQVKGSWRHLVLARTALRRLCRRDKGILFLKEMSVLAQSCFTKVTDSRMKRPGSALQLLTTIAPLDAIVAIVFREALVWSALLPTVSVCKWVIIV